MHQVVVIHGGHCFDYDREFLADLKARKVDISEFKPKRRWRDRLQEDLGDNYEVLTPQMPNKENADLTAWLIWFNKLVPFLNKGTILVGHSLGGLFLARHMTSWHQSVPDWFRAAALVSAPYDNEGLQPPYLSQEFIFSPLHYVSVSQRGPEDLMGRVHIFHAIDDPIVPVGHAEKYAMMFSQSQASLLKSGGHLNQPEFPELVDWIRQVCEHPGRIAPTYYPRS